MSLLFPRGPASGAEVVSLALQELSAAPFAVLRSDPLEGSAGVADFLAGGTAFYRVPVLAHKPLPIWVVAQIVHSFPEQCIQDRKIPADLGFGPGQVESLTHGRLRRAISPDTCTEHGSDLIRIFCQIGVVDLPPDCLFRFSDHRADRGIAVAVPYAISESLVMGVRPDAVLAVIVGPYRAVFQL